MRRLPVTGGLFLAAVVAISPSAFAQHEIMLGWETAASAPATLTLVWSDTPALPAAAIEDLTELRAAVEALRHPMAALLVSNDGRRAAAARAKRGADAATPPGVTVWPDWRVADDTITFADVSQVQFLSNNHVLLSHHPDGGPYVSFVVDVRHPTTRFHFAGHQLDTLRVTDTGTWAALTSDGSLMSGQLDAAGPGGSVTGTVVPVKGAVRNLLWRHDGQFLLIEQDGPVISSLRSTDWSPVSSVSGGLGPSKATAHPVGRDSCFGVQPTGGACVFSVSNTGTVTAARWPHDDAGETAVFVSPLGTFVITQKMDAAGFVRRHCRRTPDAAATDTVPAFPAVPRGTRIQGVGWLLWAP